MAVVVVGGQSRSVGKTSIIAGLIAGLPQMRWTAFKLTQYGHGFCTANGAPCACATADHALAVSEEWSTSSGTDTARFLAAGAARSLWVRTRQGMLAEAMPRIRKELASAENAILESNSVVEFLEPDLYLAVLDEETVDFKASARRFFDRADAVLLRPAEKPPRWPGIGPELLRSKTKFFIEPPEYLTGTILAFVRERIAQAASAAY